MLSFFARAIRRARLSVVFSQGFNPRPRLWLLMPKSLGVSCCDDLLIVDVADECTAQVFAERLGESLPAGIELNRAIALSPGRAPQPSAAVYSLELCGEEAAKVVEKIPALLEASCLGVQRLSKRNGKYREVNIRPYLSGIGLEQSELSFTVACSPAGSAKPAEILALLDLDNLSNRAKLVRTKTIYSPSLSSGLVGENN